jgi:YcxB-like protein
MRVTIPICPDERLSIASERYVLGGRRKTILFAGAAPVVAALGLLYFGRSAWPSAGVLLALGLVDLTVLPVLLPRLRGRAWLRNPGHPRLIEVSRAGVRTVCHTFELTRPWNLVAEVVELPGQYLLMLGHRHYIAIPTGKLTDDEAADLRTLIAQRDELVAA